MTQYQKALSLESEGQWEEAEQILRDLLKSDIILQEAKGKILGNGNIQSSVVHLKYCVTMNLGHCLAKQDRLKKSLKYYIEASKIDVSDLNLWYCIGTTAMQIHDLHLAASAFEEGLKCSPNHWPSIDNLVTIYYALGDYLSSLFYIYKGTKMDTGFLKGYAFKEKIFLQSPTLKDDFNLFYPDCDLPETPHNICLESDDVQQMYNVAENLIDQQQKRWKPYKIPPEPPLQPEWSVRLDSWLRLGKCLLYLLQVAEEEYPEKNLFRTVKLHVEKGYDSPVSIEDESSGAEEARSKNEEELNSDDNEEAKGRLWEKICNNQNQKRRSARVRSTIRREEPSLMESFSQIIPPDLLPRNFGIFLEGCSEDSMHTMDLYNRCFSTEENNKDERMDKVTKKQRQQYIIDEEYFSTQKELDDVAEFVRYCHSSKDSIIDLLKRFTLKLSLKWKLYWPEKLDKFFMKACAAVLRYYPVAMRCNDEPQTLNEDITVLLYGELLLNLWLEKEKSKGYISPLGDTALGGKFSTLHFGKLNVRAANSEDIEFFIRSYWLEGLLLHHSGDNESAAVALQQILGYKMAENVEIRIPNITHHAIVNKEIISNLLKSFKRNKSLTEIWRLYNDGHYEEVTEILADSLKVNIDDMKAEEVVISRPMQYSLILDSYWKQLNYKECVIWTEACLHEMLNEYRISSDEERPNVATLLVKVMQGLLACIDSMGYSICEYFIFN